MKIDPARMHTRHYVTVHGNALRKLLARAGGAVEVLTEKLLAEGKTKQAKVCLKIFNELSEMYKRHNLHLYEPKRRKGST